MIAVFRDPVDTFSPIYSLLPIGSERFVAGGARHTIIKIFDLSIPGDKLYHAADLDPCSLKTQSSLKQPQEAKQLACCEYLQKANNMRRGWNVFLKTPYPSPHRDSPVYSLSRPSQCSPSFFAGVENNVIQLDMISIIDQHPDPLFQNGPAKRYDQRDVRRKWDLNESSIALPMYEHDDGPVELLKQREDVRFPNSPARPGLDERWVSTAMHRSI